MKTCLVLEGGALRGIYTAGVLDELIKDNIEIDTIIGVSMGTLIGINYKSNQPNRVIRYNLKYCHNRNYISYYSFIKTGDVVNKKFAYDEVPNSLDPFDYDTYNHSPIKFFCTVTNIETGKAEYIEIKDVKEGAEYLRAGASMPGLSKIVEIDNKKYLDGGIADSIPVKKAIEMGYDKIIVVLTRPIEYRKKKSKLRFLQSLYKDYPNFQKTIEKRNDTYNQTVEEIIKLENDKKIFVIRPSKRVPIKRIEKNKEIIKEQYELGKTDYKSKREALKKYLER